MKNCCKDKSSETFETSRSSYTCSDSSCDVQVLDLAVKK